MEKTPSPEEITTGNAGGQPARHFLFIHQTFAALHYPNYRLWFAGQLTSLLGTWMQSTAQGYLMYELTQSPAYLGYVGFAAGVPAWLLTLYGGVIADRMPRRKLLVLTQSAMMLLAFTLAVLTFSGRVQPWHIIGLAFCLGIANAFDAPARQSFVLELVDREVLTNAIAINSMMFNMGTAIGPSIAAATYAAFGPEWCFLINGISFIAVIAALIFMKLPPFQAPTKRANSLQDLAEGLRYVSRHNVIRVLIIGMGFLSVFGMGFITLFPAWAVEVLGGDVTTNGLLQTARGIGSLIGAFTIASLGHRVLRGRLLTAGSLVFPAMLIVFAWIRWLPASLTLLIIIGWGSMTYMNLSNSLVQTHTPDELRGRVMGIYMLVFMGLWPLGSLVAGELADRLSEPIAVMMMSSIMLVAMLFALVRLPFIRRLK